MNKRNSWQRKIAGMLIVVGLFGDPAEAAEPPVSGEPAKNARVENAETPEELAWRSIRLAMQSVPKINENLINERGLLMGALTRLGAELVEIPKPSGKYADDLDSWILFAYTRERIGDTQASIASLREALRLAILIPKDAGYFRSKQLLDITERLARQGDFEGAIEAARAISTDDEGTTHITGEGVVEISETAFQSYGLMMITQLQAEFGHYDKATLTSELIADTPARAAAHWLIALQQAEANQIGKARASADTALKTTGFRFFWSKPEELVEVTIKGPHLVPLASFRVLALSRIASHQALSGNERQAAKSLGEIRDPILRDGALVELVTACAEREEFELARIWMDKIGDGRVRALAKYQFGKEKLRLRDFDAVDELTAGAEPSQWLLKLRLVFCKALWDAGERERFDEQLSLARQAIAGEFAPVRAQARLELATVQTQAGQLESACQDLASALTLVNESMPEGVPRVRALAEIGAAMAAAGSIKKSDAVFENAVQQARKLKKFESSQALLHIVTQRLASSEVSAEEIARSIPAAAQRCEALDLVATNYAASSQLAKSRALFAEAIESTKDVVNVLGIDTRYSSGGAIRLICRDQGACDLPGLMDYLAKSEDPNVIAYGYLGMAETAVPDAARRAADRGSFYPQGILAPLWEERVLSEFLRPK